MSYDISVFKFLSIGVIDPRSELYRRKKDVFLLNSAGAWKKPVTVLKRTLTVVSIVVEDLVISLI